jgi:hypothetical protein
VATPRQDSVLRQIEERYRVSLSRMPGKKVCYQGELNSNRTLLVVTPESKIHSQGQGWVDLTEIQVELMRTCTESVVAFRLSNGKVFFVNFRSLSILLTEDSIVENKKEGRHWKLYIWPNQIEVRNSSKKLQITPNDFSGIDSIFRQSAV